MVGEGFHCTGELRERGGTIGQKKQALFDLIVVVLGALYPG